MTLSAHGQGVKERQNLLDLDECGNDMVIKHEYPEGEHIRRERQSIADALFFRKQVCQSPGIS